MNDDELKEHVTNCFILLKDYFAQEKLNLEIIINIITNIFVHYLESALVPKKELRVLLNEIFDQYEERSPLDALKAIYESIEKEKPND